MRRGNKPSWLVVGGGFKGIMSAHYLLKAGMDVRLVEAAPFLGGVLYSEAWQGLYLDKGCHLFDHSDNRMTNFLFELTPSECFTPVNVDYASSIDGQNWMPGIAIADFSAMPSHDQAQLLYSCLDSLAHRTPHEPANLLEQLNQHFGEKLAGHVQRFVHKVYQLPANQIDAPAHDLTVFKRIRLTPDKIGNILKQCPELDNRLAVSSQANPMQFYANTNQFSHRNFYPLKKGLRGWCEAAEASLREKGADLQQQTKVSNIHQEKNQIRVDFTSGDSQIFDHLVWTTPASQLEKTLLDTQQLTALNHAVPMVLYYFTVHPSQLSGLTYIHNFCDAQFGYRYSAPGLYGNQRDAVGNTYICCEVPTTIGSPIWQDTEAYRDHIWQECIESGLVLKGNFTDVKTMKTPISYSIPKVGYSKTKADFMERLAQEFPNLLCMGGLSFSKTSIIEEVETGLGGYLNHE